MTAIPQPYLPDAGPGPGKLGFTKAVAPAGRTLIDLSLNESSFGASPAAVEAAVARTRIAHRYPDPTHTALRAAIAERYGLPADGLTCGDGSEELLDVITRVYARPGDEIVFPEHAFMQFSVVARRVGATAVRAPERELVADVDAILAAVTKRTRIVFLANPNNPVGTYIPRGELHRLAAGLPTTVVLVIDSAYAEFVEAEDFSAGHELVGAHDNIIVTRTFSKAYGLAAYRVGWAHGPAAMIRVMNQVRGIGNVNAPALEAAAAALGDRAHLARVVKETGQQRRDLADALHGMGLKVVPSVTNFLMVEFPHAHLTAAKAHAHLLNDGIVVRPLTDYGFADHLRIGVGTHDECAALIASLRGFLTSNE